MNISKESLQDISEEDPALLEENSRTDKDAENYHISMLTRRQTAGFNDLPGEAGRALRAASPITRAEFFKKWG